jgi:hypothetical protein
MRLAAHQPQYLPWLGFFDKMDRVDLFVLLDTVQYKKNEWQNRNRIRTADGWQWLTVPVHHRFPMTLAEVRIDESASWRRKHAEALRLQYAHATHRAAILPPLLALLRDAHTSLAALNVDGVKLLAGLLGVRTPIVLASTLDRLPGGADDRLIALCRRFGCRTYLAGAGGQDYMEIDAYRRAGIAVEFQEFRHPVYPQAFPGFEPNLSAVDLLMSEGTGAIARVRETREVAA